MLPCEGQTPSGKKSPFSSSPSLCLLRRPPRLFKEKKKILKINTLNPHLSWLFLPLASTKHTWFSTSVINKQVRQQFHGGFLIEANHSLIKRILVLHQPVIDVVVNNASVVNQGEMGLWFTLDNPGLLEVVWFPQMVVIKLSFECCITGFGEHALLFKDGHDTHGLANNRARGFKLAEQCWSNTRDL